MSSRGFCAKCWRNIQVSEEDRALGKPQFCGKCVPQKKVRSTTLRHTFTAEVLKTGLIRVTASGRIFVEATEAEAQQLAKVLLDALTKAKKEKE